MRAIHELGIQISEGLTQSDSCVQGAELAPKEISKKSDSEAIRFDLKQLRGSQGMGVVSVLTVFCSQFVSCSNPHVDRCSNPLPWDPLSKKTNI